VAASGRLHDVTANRTSSRRLLSANTRDATLPPQRLHADFPCVCHHDNVCVRFFCVKRNHGAGVAAKHRGFCRDASRPGAPTPLERGIPPVDRPRGRAARRWLPEEASLPGAICPLIVPLVGATEISRTTAAQVVANFSAMPKMSPCCCPPSTGIRILLHANSRCNDRSAWRTSTARCQTRSPAARCCSAQNASCLLRHAST